MGMPVRIDNQLYEQAKSEAKAEHRTIAGQIEFWATVGRAAIDNPELPVVKRILIRITCVILRIVLQAL